MSKNKNQAGFMIIETLIVGIVVLVIIVIAVSVFGNIGRKHRNAERKNDVKLIQKSAEDYFAQTEKYPTLANLNDPAWLAKNMKGLNVENIRDPKQKVANVAPAPVVGAYSYQVLSNDNQPCDNASRDCSSYIITATLEGGEPAYVQNNYY